MRARLLNLCIFTLLQSRYVLSGEDLWLPNLSKLSSIIYSCHNGPKQLPLPLPLPLQLNLDNESISNKRVELKSSARSEGDGSAQSSANVIIRNGDRVLTISNNVDLGPGKKGLPRRATNGKSDKSSIESSVSFNLGDALTDPLSLLQKLYGNSITKVNGKIQPRSGQGKKDNPISISIGDNNANNQIIQDDRKQPAATAVLSVEPVDIKPQPRTPWEVGFSISGGSSSHRRRPRAPPSDQSLAKDQMYSRIANCVRQKLLEEYKQNSAN
ncbi:uncharacterized protein Dwil_GK28262 [Drosophila willistoni]|uniref:uncharacterized protein LOC26530264 n=1 Tax=Drosophila willistoni TaxID=7260 RepID=UPI000732A31D|nr:uncharacterized protein LOC26530264 [Drosophila willistoni]KRF98036.1 uncharacterized protein Dwil_GK28262 [Drosophila willistoni]